MKKYFYKILLLFLLIIPINVFAYSKYVIPGGETIGIEINSKGILVDIKQIDTVTLGSDDCKGGSLEEVYPDYYRVEENFQNLVDEYEDDDEYDEDDE